MSRSLFFARFHDANNNDGQPVIKVFLSIPVRQQQLAADLAAVPPPFSIKIKLQNHNSAFISIIFNTFELLDKSNTYKYLFSARINTYHLPF